MGYTRILCIVSIVYITPTVMPLIVSCFVAVVALDVVRDSNIFAI